MGPFLFPLQDFKDYSDCITMGGAKGKGKADGDGWIHTGDDVNDVIRAMKKNLVVYGI